MTDIPLKRRYEDTMTGALVEVVETYTEELGPQGKRTLVVLKVVKAPIEHAVGEQFEVDNAVFALRYREEENADG